MIVTAARGQWTWTLLLLLFVVILPRRIEANERGWHGRSLRSLQEVVVNEYNVELFLSLYYVDHDVASQLAAGEPQNPVVSQFCRAISEQAQGPQVMFAAADVNAVVTTRVKDNGGSYLDYQCRILQTNRLYDRESQVSLGDEYLILEVAVGQTVNVSTLSNETLGLDEVVDIVETGYSRGTGGRVKFREELRGAQNGGFFDFVRNVEVLDGALSLPQAPPSPAPVVSPTTEFPSGSPSLATSVNPSLEASLHPSEGPTLRLSTGPSLRPSTGPSQRPSLSSSEVPTSLPSSLPSFFPSSQVTNSPTHEPSDQPAEQTKAPIVSPSAQPVQPTRRPTGPSPLSSNDSLDRQPFILAAVVGGLATIVVSCFFIWCVWFPLCGECCKKQDDESVEDEIVFPEVLRLAEDNQSLADTSIGDFTAGGAFRLTAPNSRPVGLDGGESVDDNSLYTTPYGETPQPNRSNKLFNKAASGGAVHDSKVLGEDAEDKFGTGPIDVDALEDLMRASDAPSSSISAPGIMNSDTRREKKQGTVVMQPSPPKPLPEQSLLTKGFDPFEEKSSSDSSFGFDSEAHSSFGTFKAAEDSSIASTSSQRHRDEGLQLLGLGQSPGDQAVAEEEKRQIDEVHSRVESMQQPYGKQVERRRTYSSDDGNNSLLRSVLEDARRLADAKSKSPTARSRKSAPSRTIRSHSYLVTPEDLLADNQEIGQRGESNSVGALPFTRAQGTQTFYRSDPGCTHSINSAALERPQHIVPIGTARLTAIPLRRKVELSGSSPGRDYVPPTLGAQPRPDAGMIEDADTPASSPGVLGIASKEDDTSSNSGLSNPWLFDAIEQTLGPMSSAADMESITGRSVRSGNSKKSSRSYKSHASGKSGKSYRSRRSAVSTPSNLEEARTQRWSTSRRTHHGEKFGNSDFRQGSDENKGSTNDICSPRSLENDLKRLEIQLSEVSHAEQDHVTTSSITASSAGASRSTRSSRAMARHKQKRTVVVVVVPPGKVGVVLADRVGGMGTVVSGVRATSAIHGMLSPGDKLVAVDGEDVSHMLVSEITALMASRAGKERRLTVLSSSASRSYDQPDFKQDEEDFM